MCAIMMLHGEIYTLHLNNISNDFLSKYNLNINKHIHFTSYNIQTFAFHASMITGRALVPNSPTVDGIVNILERDIRQIYPAGESNVSRSIESPKEIVKIS